MDLRERNGAVLLSVKAVPGASREKVSRLGDALKVAVAAPAEKGRANEALLRVLAAFFGARVELVSGAGSARKQVAVRAPRAEVLRRIEELE